MGDNICSIKKNLEKKTREGIKVVLIHAPARSSPNFYGHYVNIISLR
jgi:hypothetical protein